MLMCHAEEILYKPLANLNAKKTSHQLLVSLFVVVKESHSFHNNLLINHTFAVAMCKLSLVSSVVVHFKIASCVLCVINVPKGTAVQFLRAILQPRGHWRRKGKKAYEKHSSFANTAF